MWRVFLSIFTLNTGYLTHLHRPTLINNLKKKGKSYSELVLSCLKKTTKNFNFENIIFVFFSKNY